MIYQGTKIEHHTVVDNMSPKRKHRKISGRTDKKAPYKPAANTSGVVASIALKSTVKSR